MVGMADTEKGTKKGTKAEREEKRRERSGETDYQGKVGPGRKTRQMAGTAPGRWHC